MAGLAGPRHCKVGRALQAILAALAASRCIDFKELTWATHRQASFLQRLHAAPDRQLAGSRIRRHSIAFGPTFVAEAPTAQDAVVIWLHGLGDTGQGWSDVGPQLQQIMPSVKFLFPTAPTQPVTVNGGMSMPSWFDINSLEPELFTLDPPGIAESAEYVRSLVKEQLNDGIAPDRIVLAGFSQGGAVVLGAALGPNAPAVRAVLVLSSFLGCALSEVPTSAPAIHFFHGEADPVVPMDWGHRSYETLKMAGLSPTFRSYAGMQHSACAEELQDIATVLNEHLSTS